MSEPTLTDALTAAMAMVPNLYSRNRMFERFKDPVVRRARARARMVRSLLRFVARQDVEAELARGLLTYRIRRLRLDRTVRLTDLELAVLRLLLAKGPHLAPLANVLAEQVTDRPRVEAALALLPKEAA